MGEWKTYRLGDICTLVAGFAFKSKDFGDYPDKVIKIADIQPPIVDMSSLTGIDISQYNCQKLEKYKTQKGDYVLAMTGATIGKLGRIVSKKNAYINQRVLLFKPIDKYIDKNYLYYYLCQNTFFSHIRNHIDSETAQPNISANSIGEFTLTLPPLDEQRRIAGILGSLDDKIELNRRINANLEAQAQALFRSWFVDFEPFRDGPFVDSELGKIPQGWKVLLFSDFCEHSTQKVEDRTVTEYSVTNSGMFPREQKYTKQLSQNISKDKLIRKRDLVFGMSREILNWGIMKNDQEGGVSAAYTVYHIKDEIDSTYLENYITFHKPYFKDLIKPAAREGQGIDKKIFENKILYYPPQNVLNNFFAIYNTLITNNQNEEIKTLSALRDTLLPQLMAGEINVK